VRERIPRGFVDKLEDVAVLSFAGAAIADRHPALVDLRLRGELCPAATSLHVDGDVADFEAHLVDADGGKSSQRVAVKWPKIPTGDRELAHGYVPSQAR